MKSKIAKTMTALVTILFLLGCASVSKVKVPAAKESPKTYDLYDLYLTKDAQQMTGVAKDAVKLNVGETVTIYARGCSFSNNRYCCYRKGNKTYKYCSLCHSCNNSKGWFQN